MLRPAESIDSDSKTGSIELDTEAKTQVTLLDVLH